MPAKFILTLTESDGSSREHRLAEGSYLIGRDPDCEIVVGSPDVSRHHARITLGAAELSIEDLGSSTGTAVQSLPVSKTPQRWPYPQTLSIGSVRLDVRQMDAAAQPPITALGADPEASVPFVFGNEIARGGMGSIIEADDKKLGRKIAVKVMLLESGADDEQKQRFVQEAAVLGRLAHPNIVPVYDLGLDSRGQLYYSMKLVKGRTLQAILDDLRKKAPEITKHYSLDRLLTVFRKVCDAVAFAHSRGIIHRDLKPENVMVGEFGEVLLMDWGLAKVLKDEGGRRKDEEASSENSSFIPNHSSLTATLQGSVMGTPQYMSPEQAEGRMEDMDARSDIFSLGGVLYAILTLHPPVQGKALDEVLSKVAQAMITPPSAFGTTTGNSVRGAKETMLEAGRISPMPHCPGGKVPAALSAVAMKALSRKRERRYASVAAFDADIEAYQGGFATSAEKAGAWKQFTLFVKRNRAASIGVAAVLAIGGVLGTKALIDGRHAERMLEELRGTAPTFEAQSRALLNEGKPGDALMKIAYAVKLAPRNADYHLFRANLFQSAQQLDEGAAEYRTVLALRPGDEQAKQNLDLCEKLLAEKGGAAELNVTLQGRVLDALIAQHRDLEAAPLAKLLRRDNQIAEATVRARLVSYTTQKGWTEKRIASAWGYGATEKGFRVDLTALQLGDLNALQALPIVDLHLAQTLVTDLQPLIGLPLETLSLKSTRVADLSALRGMKLRKLDISNTAVSDLSPLAGMPLKILEIGNNRKLHDLKPLAGMPLEVLDAEAMALEDLSPLRGLPLRELLLARAREIPDCSPLAHCPTLQKISLPWDIRDIGFLATLPRLQQVEYHAGAEPDRWILARDFLAMYGPDVPEIKAARAALAAAGVKALPIWKVVLDPDHHLRLSVASTPLADLAGFRGLPIKELDLFKTSVSDLEPLRGMPLRKLRVVNTKVSNLEPLRGLPLTHLDLSGAGLRDVAPLGDCKELEALRLPARATNVECLRTLPKLRYLSTRWDSKNDRPDQTVADFWNEYDLAGSPGKR